MFPSVGLSEKSVWCEMDGQSVGTIVGNFKAFTSLHLPRAS